MAMLRSFWSNKKFYQKEKLLAEGSVAHVYSGFLIDPKYKIRKHIVLKVFKSKSKNFKLIFRKEIQNLFSVNSAYCVQILDWIELKGHPTLVMERVHGLTLQEILHRCHEIPLQSQLYIIDEIHNALLDLKTLGIHHGDLSLNNVLIDYNGQIKLIDFGLAQVLEFETFCTPEFAAPETLSGQGVSHASDLFSLGKIGARLGLHEDIKSLLPLSPEDRKYSPTQNTTHNKTNLIFLLQKRLTKTHLPFTQGQSTLPQTKEYDFYQPQPLSKTKQEHFLKNLVKKCSLFWLISFLSLGVVRSQREHPPLSLMKVQLLSLKGYEIYIDEKWKPLPIELRIKFNPLEKQNQIYKWRLHRKVGLLEIKLKPHNQKINLDLISLTSE